MFKPDKYERILILIFLITLPLTNPWVRGDGVGYYAYVRSLLIEKHLNFEQDWRHGNESFVRNRFDGKGQILASEYTQTGRLDNHWSIGPSLLWAPFLVAVHLVVQTCDRLGAHIPADGFSAPYLTAMALATTLYGFLALWFSYQLAIQYFDRRSAFLATLGIWWASSLPAYMYFNPSWSHAHSAFAVALFLWYWHRTRSERTILQWVVLGLFSGLMVNVYYVNGVLLLVPLLEALVAYWKNWVSSTRNFATIARLFAQHLAYICVFLVALLPTLISRQIIFGSPVRTGYSAEKFNWKSPALRNVIFSWDHGMISWTPILILALIGLVLFYRRDHLFGVYILASFLAFYYVISIQPTWDGNSSFGSRYFVSLSPLFILGLAAFFDWLARSWQERPARIFATCTISLLILWNLGLLYQWGMHLIPTRGPISFRQAAYNQIAVVPPQAARSVKNYFLRRHQLMNHIEDKDIQQLNSTPRDGNE
ncbi:MAG: glycosyltransferase family 39 protein [Candidatus Acidiferrales bacterium]